MKKSFKLLLVALFIMIIPVVISAKSVIEVITEGNESNYKIDGNYGWTFNFKNTTTTASTYHAINNESDARSHKTMVATEDNYYNQSKNYYISNASDCSDGKIYVLYNNVGTYQGKKVNLKITVDSCKLASNYGGTIDGYTYSTPNIGFATIGMQVIMNGIRSVDLTYNFIDEAGNKLDLKGYGTFTDLDESQAFKMGEGIDKAYIYENYSQVCLDTSCSTKESRQHLYKDKLTSDSNYSTYLTAENAIQSSNLTTTSSRTFKYAWATVLFSGGTFKLTYYTGKPGWETQFTAGGMFIFYPDSLVPFGVEDPVKSVNKTEISRSEEYIYTTSHRVPYINKDGSNNTYSAYSFYDKLEPCLAIKDISKIVIKNDEGTDVTSNFIVETSEENGSVVVTAVAKDSFLTSDNFYGHEYEFMITTYVKNNYDLSKYLNSDKTKYIIPNKASVSVTDNSGVSNNDTNVVNVYIPIPKQVIDTPDTGKYVSITLIIAGSILAIIGIATLIVYKKYLNKK